MLYGLPEYDPSSNSDRSLMRSRKIPDALARTQPDRLSEKNETILCVLLGFTFMNETC